MTITYFVQPSGKFDESVAVAKNLKNKDLTSASVILDFRDQSVVKCSMNGVTVRKEWKKIRDFYYQHYPQYIDQLERLYKNNLD